MEALRSTLLVVFCVGGFLATVWETAGVVVGGFLILMLIGAVAKGSDHAPQHNTPTLQPPISGTSQTTANGNRVIYDRNGHPTFLTRNPATGDWQDESGHPYDMDEDFATRR